MPVQQRLAGLAERGEHLLLGILEPAEEVREPRDAGRIGIGPVHFLANLEERHES